MGTALVTGATAGIGLEIAWELASSRHDLVLVARSADRLEGVARQIRAAAAVHVEVLVADLGTGAGREAVVDRLRSSDRPVGLLVNNAGFGLGQPFLGGSPAREEEALELMVRTVLVLSQAAAEAMVRRGRGAILNVSSVASLTAMGTYAAHKAWVRVFTEGLAAELQGTGVTATVLCPGLVHTEFHERAGLRRSAWPDAGWLDAGRVARAALTGVRRGRVIVTPSVRYSVVSAVLRLAPRWSVRRATGPRTSARALGRLGEHAAERSA